MTTMGLTGVGSGELIVPSFATYTDIPGLWLWAEAQKDTGYANNDPVGTLLDSSSQVNTMTQATGAAKPTYKTGEVNALQAYSFDGGDYVQKTSAAGLGSSSAFSIFAVIKRAGTGARRTILYAGDSTNAGMQITIDSSEKFRLTKSQIEEVGASATNVSNAGYELWEFILGSGAYTIYRNATSDASGSYGNSFTLTGSPVIYMGANSGIGELMNGNIALLLAYNSALGTTNRQNVENKVRADYALW